MYNQNQSQGGYHQPPGYTGGPSVGGAYAPNFPGNTSQGYPSPPGQYVPPGPYSPYPPSPQQNYAPQQSYVPPSYVPPGYGQPPPVVHQPGQGPPPPQPSAPGGWMNIPAGGPPGGCPPGLEYLTMIDQLLVHQKVEILEALTGFETNNKFTVKNSVGQKVYYAVEDTDCCTRNCCGPLRPFEMKILDNYRNQVINLHRPLACDSCCFPCCLQSMEVSSPPGTLIGSIQQQWSILEPLFHVCDATGGTVLIIKGPFCTFSMCGDVEFKIYAKDGETAVGKISKQWSGLLREMFTDADYFGITFPMDLDVRMKAVLLGACFLIDAMFFEKQNNQERDRPGMF